jgi:hypothetical protein
MKRIFIIVCAALLSFAYLSASAEDLKLAVTAPAEEIRPGRPSIVTINAPEDGTCSILLEDERGTKICSVVENRTVTAGYNALYWNGTDAGLPAPVGEWILTAEMNGERATTKVIIGTLIPSLIAPKLETETETENGIRAVEEGDTVLLSFHATEPGTLILQEADMVEPIYWDNLSAGPGEVSFQAEMTPGIHTLILTLAGEDGTLSEPVSLTIEVLEKKDPNAVPTPEPLPDYLREKSENGFTPLHLSARRGEDQTLNAWTVPMDITDEEAVWKALTAPITVLDNGKKNAEKTQVIIRSQPSDSSDGIGVVTCVSQGVHVLEQGEEWSLIECHSSSFHDSPILNWNTFVRGYVPTAYLRTLLPNQQMGIVVDKLTQRLYLFLEGKLFSTLLISTGVANAKQPYNETRSGEFLLISKVGEFSSDNMRCPMAIRFNDGDLLHEVPYISSQEGRFRDYSINEPKLGTKASHGCIRVQRQASPEGVSQKWIWNNYRKNTKIIIWEDWQGRQIPIPKADTLLYCLKKKNGNYHTTDRCSQIRGKKNVITLTYGELSEEENRKLNPCPLCAAPSREETIREINAIYAEGGDHDPVLTEARKKCPRKLKTK